MLGYTLSFLILAQVAGFLGLRGLAGFSEDLAWACFVVFFVLSVAAGVARALRGDPPSLAHVRRALAGCGDPPPGSPTLPRFWGVSGAARGADRIRSPVLPHSSPPR